MRSSARSLIATVATTKMCVFANALESRRRATRFYCCGQVGGQEYSELSNSTLLISSAPGIGTNRQLGIFRNSEYRVILYAKDDPLRRLTEWRNTMSRTVKEKRARFRELHQSGCFILPNPWDVGSARMLEAVGF